MIRYAFTLLAAMGAVAAAAAIQDAPAAAMLRAAAPAHETVIAKNSAFPVLGPVDWVQCNTDDCSDVPNQ